MAQQLSQIDAIRKANAAVLTAHSRVSAAAKSLELANEQLRKAADELESLIQQARQQS